MAIQALRGESFPTATARVAELGYLTRFRHPRELMAYLGLVPSEHSSGPSVRRGGITEAGNPHVRRLLAEAACDQGFRESVILVSIAVDAQRMHLTKNDWDVFVDDCCATW